LKQAASSIRRARATSFCGETDGEPGKQLSFDALVVADGDDIQIGTPVVKGAKVRAKIVEHGKEKKVVIFKYKPKEISAKAGPQAAVHQDTDHQHRHSQGKSGGGRVNESLCAKERCNRDGT
jgi:ribosomal protein L21